MELSAHPADADEIIRLSALFEPPSLEAWRVSAEAALKGRPLESLVRATADGVVYGPLHTAQDAPPSSRANARPRDPDRPWDVRTLVAHPSPAAANDQALEDLENGAASILLRLDPAGRRGVACRDAADMERVLAGVQTELAPVALDAGAQGLKAAEWLSRAARRGPSAPLAFHIDPLGAYARTGVSAYDMRAHMAQAGELASELARTHPAATQFIASGRAVHEAGGSEAQELGFAAACALAYARASAAAGLPEGEAFAGVVIGLAADPRYFVTIAKLRAARLIAAKLARACGGDASVRIEASTAERTLSTLDPWNNALRSSLGAFGAAVGGADAVVVTPFTAPLTEDGRATADAFARRQARNAQLILLDEAHLGRVEDVAGGSWFIERLTDGLARAGWSVMQAIEREGGALAAIRNGAFAGDVARARQALESAYATRGSALVGVSEFVSAARDAVTVEALDDTAGPTPTSALVERCAPLAPWRAAASFEDAILHATPQTAGPQTEVAA